MIYGVGTHIVASNRDRGMAALRDLGAQSTRDEISWSSTELTAGVFALNSGHLAKLSAWSSVGRDNVGILLYGNGLYDIGQPYTQAERDRFAAYVRFIVPVIAPHCRYIEIWNEWDIGAGRNAAQVASGNFGGASEYVALCATVAQIIRELAPNAVILGGAVGNIRKVWIDAMMDAGVMNHVDAISLHTYNYNSANPSPADSVSKLVLYQSWLAAKNGGNTVDVYVTEHGWPTHTTGADVGQPASVVSIWLSRFYRACELLPWVKGVWWYDLWDDGTDPLQKEHRFGLLANDAITPKPAYHAFKGLTHRDRTDQYGWCRVAVTAAVQAQINARTLPERAQHALSALSASGETVAMGARTLNVLTGPINLAALDAVGERLLDNLIIIEGPVVRGQVPAQTTVTKTQTWPNGWS